MAPTHHPERGSVIIWILVMVAMFAALSFTVSNMMRGGGSAMTSELTRTHASEIISYGDSIRRAVQTLRASGTALPEVSFENNFVSGYINNNCLDDSCRIFMPAGAGIAYAPPHEDWIDVSKSAETYYNEWHFAPDSCIPDVGTGGAACGGDSVDNEDLILFLPYVKKGLCMEINRQINIDNPNSDAPQDSGCPWDSGSNNRYTGNFIDGQAVTSTPASLLAGRQNGCFKIGVCAGYATGSYIYYQVLAPR